MTQKEAEELQKIVRSMAAAMLRDAVSDLMAPFIVVKEGSKKKQFFNSKETAEAFAWMREDPDDIDEMFSFGWVLDILELRHRHASIMDKIDAIEEARNRRKLQGERRSRYATILPRGKKSYSTMPVRDLVKPLISLTERERELIYENRWDKLQES